MTIDPEKARLEYYLALGEFHHSYTDLEHELTCIVRNVVTEGMQKHRHVAAVSAVLGGLRMAPARDTIKRLMRVLGMSREEREAVDKAFAHLGEIQFLRDRLAHHFTTHDDNRPGTWVNDDFAGVRELSKWTTIEFTHLTLRAATADLRAIKVYLDGLFCQHITPLPGINLPPFDLNAFPAWQYKPVVPAPQRQPSGRSG